MNSRFEVKDDSVRSRFRSARKLKFDDSVVFYRHFLSALPAIILFVVTAILSLYFSVTYPASVQWISLFRIGGFQVNIAIPLFALVPFALGALIIHQLYDCRYEIGDGYVRCTSGRLGFSKQDLRINMEHIRGIEIDRSLYGRIVNIGDLRIGSAMHEEVEIVMGGVFDPSHYRNIVTQRMKSRAYRLSREWELLKMGSYDEDLGDHD